MKKIMIAVVLATFPTVSAFADGFECQTVRGDLNVKMYNKTHAEDGTRNVAVMVLSDPAVQTGRKTIARFRDINATLVNTGAFYTANVDHRFNDSGRKGELISGTKLGQLKTIEVSVDFSYLFPVEAGTELQGAMVLVKRNGQEITRPLVCTRYLKQ